MDVNALLFSPKSVIDVQHGVGGLPQMTVRYTLAGLIYLSSAHARAMYTNNFMQIKLFIILTN